MKLRMQSDPYDILCKTAIGQIDAFASLGER